MPGRHSTSKLRPSAVVVLMFLTLMLAGAIVIISTMGGGTHRTTVAALPDTEGPPTSQASLPELPVLLPSGSSQPSSPPPPSPAGNPGGTVTPTHTGGAPRPSPPKPSPTPPRTTAPPQPVARSYEAESPANTLAGGAQPASCPFCSGGWKVGWVGYGGTLQWNGVQSTATGQVNLTIWYVNGDATRWALVSIDGGNGFWVSFPSTGGWDRLGTVTLSVGLRAGTNRLEFLNSRAWAPDFDRISFLDPAG